MKKLYRITTQEVNADGTLGALVDIVEAEANELQSGQNVFHLVAEISARIDRESNEAS
jgi:hypothetical protein